MSKESKSKSKKESCPVCTEIYTKAIRKKCICKYCKADTCSKCIERYLLDRHEDAHCMHCRVNYNDTTLHEICTKTYLQHTYFKHRQDVLINRERANLPGLQDIAVMENRKRDNEIKIAAIKDSMIHIENERDVAIIEYNKLHDIYTADPTIDTRKKLDDLLVQMESYRTQISIKRHDIDNIRYRVDEPKEEKKKFIRRCTRDNCQGFLSTAWKCGICEYYSCPKCFKIKTKKHDDPHECSKEDLETAELIKKDCKPCPNCGEFIMKTSGCFAPDVPILMFDGSLKMSQDITIWDKLVGDDGSIRIVLDTCSGVDTMYEVKQTGGINYTVNSKHTLVLKYEGECVPYWDDSHWNIYWFDRVEHVHCTYRTFGAQSIGDMNDFRKKLAFDDIKICVEDYMNLDDSVKEKLVGFKSWRMKQDVFNMGICIVDEFYTITSHIEVVEIGLGEYYGWKVDSNSKFLLSDTTILHNCDQMFCITCKTPWSWTTGKAVTSGPIHNPHYYEWLKRNGSAPRNPADVPCGGFPDAWEIRKIPKGVPNADLFYEFHRMCMELQDISERTYRSHIDNNTNAINIKFLLGDYDEKHWGQLLAKDERKKKRDAEVQEIFAAFRMVAVELINRVHRDPRRIIPILEIKELFDALHIEITALITMINEALRVVSISYRYSVPYIRIIKKYYHIHTNNFAKSDLKMSDKAEGKVEGVESKVEGVEGKAESVESAESKAEHLNTEIGEMDEHTQLQLAIAASLSS